MDYENNLAETIAREARKPLALTVQPTLVVHAVPEGYTLDVRDPHKDDPNRLRGSTHFDTVESFIQYLNTFGKAGQRVYCRADYLKGSCQMVGVINDHQKDGADYQDHRALYAPRLTVEWTTWNQKNKAQMSQADFAMFIEDNMKDIASVDGLPSGAEMFAMARQLEINRDARIKSAIRPQSGGVVLEYVDTDDEGTVQRMQVFERFALGIKPFLEGSPYQIDARLRYRVNAGTVTFWYELIRPDLTIAAAVKDEIASVQEKAGVPVLMGALQ